MGFYIKEISVDYATSKDVISFKEGLNIISGPSNTGKSMILNCIDFMFGAQRNPFDKAIGCISVSMKLVFDSKEMDLTRKLDEDSVSVSSQNDNVESKIYYCGKSTKKPQVSEIFLKLIGLSEVPSIVVNKKFKKNFLTWRTILHMLYLSEERIISSISPLLTSRPTDNTKCLSVINFLLKGEESSYEEQESKDIKEAKKDAVRNFINAQISSLSLRKEKIQTEINELNHIDYLKEIENISNEIKSIEESIINGVNENKYATSQIQQLNEHQAENLCLLNNYKKLHTQYESDLKRLSFIIDGESNLGSKKLSGCPFCNTPISISRKEKYTDAALAESRKIKTQIEDLNSAQNDLKEEIDSIYKKIAQFEEKNKEILRINENDYKPRILELKEKMEEYKVLWRKENEISFITESCKLQEKYLEEKINVVEPVEVYDPKPLLKEIFIPKFTEKLKANLAKAGFENLNALYLDENSVDLVINGLEKRTNGKGFRAFFNSVMALSFVDFLADSAKFKPNFVVLDSPILSLKEKEGTEIKESLKSGLFGLFIEKSSKMQIIIVENEIPSINYQNANIIEFTKNKNNGRYGFLSGVSN
ncbi:MAG: AAA family ATPase [Fibrobacter sp.]|nr:AAA family ATPase [Fibrobacter sp.]